MFLFFLKSILSVLTIQDCSAVVLSDAGYRSICFSYLENKEQSFLSSKSFRSQRELCSCSYGPVPQCCPCSHSHCQSTQHLRYSVIKGVSVGGLWQGVWGWPWVSSFILSVSCFGTGSLMEAVAHLFGYTGWPASSRKLPLYPSPSQSWGDGHVLVHWECWGLGNPCSGSQACTVNTLPTEPSPLSAESISNYPGIFSSAHLFVQENVLSISKFQTCKAHALIPLRSV